MTTFASPPGKCWMVGNCPYPAELVVESVGTFGTAFRSCRTHAIEKVDQAIAGKLVGKDGAYRIRSFEPGENVVLCPTCKRPRE